MVPRLRRYHLTALAAFAVAVGTTYAAAYEWYYRNVHGAAYLDYGGHKIDVSSRVGHSIGPTVMVALVAALYAPVIGRRTRRLVSQQQVAAGLGLQIEKPSDPMPPQLLKKLGRVERPARFPTELISTTGDKTEPPGRRGNVLMCGVWQRRPVALWIGCVEDGEGSVVYYSCGMCRCEAAAGLGLVEYTAIDTWRGFVHSDLAAICTIFRGNRALQVRSGPPAPKTFPLQVLDCIFESELRAAVRIGRGWVFCFTQGEALQRADAGRLARLRIRRSVGGVEHGRRMLELMAAVVYALEYPGPPAGGGASRYRVAWEEAYEPKVVGNP